MIQRYSWPELGFVGFVLRSAADNQWFRASGSMFVFILPAYGAGGYRIGWSSLTPGNTLHAQLPCGCLNTIALQLSQSRYVVQWNKKKGKLL